MDPGVWQFAFLVGAFSFFSPCSVALLPAYAGFYLGTAGPQAPTRARDASVFGAAAAAGILTLYAIGGAAVYALRAAVQVSSLDLGRGLSVLALLVGFGLVGLGLLTWADRAPTLRLPLRAPQGRSHRSMFLFGAAYALASLGCTLPLFLAVAANIVVQGPLGGALTVLSFGAGVAGLMFAVTLALALAENATRRFLRRAAPWIRPVSGTVLVAAGAYVVYYYAVASPPV